MIESELTESEIETESETKFDFELVTPTIFLFSS